MVGILSPAPPLIAHPFDSPPPLHQSYFFLTYPSDLSLFVGCLKVHTHTHMHLYLLYAYVPDCNPAPQRWIKAEGVMMVCRHTGRGGGERTRRERLNCERDRDEWWRLQSLRQRDRGRYKGKEGDLCIHHGSHRVLLCAALVEQVSQTLISSSCKPGPHGKHNHQ